MPSEDRIQSSNLTAFMAAAGREWGMRLPDYDAVYRWSINSPHQFWKSLWDFIGIVAERRGDVIVDNPGSMLQARFFPGARLSFAENLLRRRNHSLAVIFRREDGLRKTLTCRALYDLVSRVAQALAAMGVKSGDRVVSVLPNIPEALVCMLATNSIGAIWSSCSPDFGVKGIIDRLGQVGPKVLFAPDGYLYNGKAYETLSIVKQLEQLLPALEHVVLLPYLRPERPPRLLPKAVPFEDFIGPYASRDIEFARLPFDHPGFILYTSGTTGAPKCILHGAGRVLIQLLKEHWLHWDVKPGDRFYYYTTTGWNMWYTLVTALAPGAVAVMYDGSPFYPERDAIFDLADEEQITILGTSPKYLEEIRKDGLAPLRTHTLDSLKAILSTGAPLSADSFDYVYENIKRDVMLSSLSGGTEIMTTFANGNPIGAVWQGELQVRTLGMKTEIFDEDGRSVVGQKGELVCTAPFPSQPLRFWNDPGNRRYHETYFSRFPNVWCHGDYAEVTEHGGMIIYGRSDAVLNPGGIRIGTAEIYRPVEALEEVADALVVGQDWNHDVRVVLFVKLSDGIVLDDALTEKIRQAVRRYATPRHVPAKIIQVADIPYTINGKKVEVAVRDVIHGRSVKNSGSLANPEVLELFRNLPELNADDSAT